MSNITPISIIPKTSGKVFEQVHATNTNDFRLEGVGVMASLDGDAKVDLVFDLPPTLPTGTAKLRILSFANATSGVAKINPKWASKAPEESLDIAEGSLNAESASTVTWASGDADVPKETKITLDADTIVAGELVMMTIEFDSTSWTLAAVSTHQFSIIWE
jgi:hypothetical protein